MQAPPMSPPLMQPVKKQRAGNTPEADLATRAEAARSARRAELQKLQQQTGAMRSLPSVGPPVGASRPPVGSGPPLGSGPPVMPRGALGGQQPRQAGASLRGGGRPTATALSGSPPLRAGPPAGAPPVFRTTPAAAPSGSTGAPPLFGGSTRTAPATAPPKPGRAMLEPRNSDIFPGVVKSPKSPKPIVQPMYPGAAESSPKPAAHATAAALKSPKSPNSQDTDLARRLEESFTSNLTHSPGLSRFKSAPPTRPPPPPGPPPLNKEAPATVAAAQKKTVAFQPGSPMVSMVSPRTVKKPTNSTAGSTPFPGKEDPNPETTTPPDANKMHAGMTPFHPTVLSEKKPSPPDASKMDAGRTPFYPNPEATASETKPHPPSSAGRTPFRASTEADMEPTPPSTARRDLLRTMRAAASTPPEKTASAEQSPELRLTKELARAEKEKAGALRQVTQLQDEAAKIRGNELLQTILQMADSQGDKAALEWARKNINTPSPVKQVGFLSPLANIINSPMASPSSRRRAATPHPKRNREKPGAQPVNAEEEKAFLIEAAECSPHEYGSEMATFTIRRPFGLATERNLWMSAGQLNAKMYANCADVNMVSTLEVIATLEADDSVFVLHGESDVRHQRKGEPFTEFGNVEERNSPLGSVSYIDKDATEKDYSLDDLYEAAAAVRQYYCSTVLATAAGLQMRKESKVPETPAAPGPTSKVVETSDKGVVTDTVKEPPEQKQKSARPPPPEEESSDVLAVFIQLFFSTIFGTIWFICVTIPFRIITSTFVLSVAIVLLSIIWLYLADDNGAADMGATVRMYSNRPGIL